jgi:hypothetical protein
MREIWRRFTTIFDPLHKAAIIDRLPFDELSKVGSCASFYVRYMGGSSWRAKPPVKVGNHSQHPPLFFSPDKARQKPDQPRRLIPFMGQQLNDS